jgi:hypothetical protein
MKCETTIIPLPSLQKQQTLKVFEEMTEIIILGKRKNDLKLI